MTKKNNTELKNIGKGFISKAFEMYPEWRGSVSLPKAQYPEVLQNVDLSQKQMAQLPLNDIEKSVLCGTIFGDTSFAINKGYANARFQVKHSTRQFTWFTWKYFVVLKEFSNLNGIVYTKPDGYQAASPPKDGEGSLGKLKLASKAHPKLTKLHTIICKDNRKTIQRFWLNHMNNYFLMTIWLDDGSLSCQQGRQGVISFNSMPEEQQLIFREYLLKVWGIETKFQDTGLVMQNGKPSLRIIIDGQENLLKLLRIIAPVIPVREMLYKVCFVPNGNPSLLQRWKTELKGLVQPQFVNDIENHYSDIDNLRKMQEEKIQFKI